MVTEYLAEAKETFKKGDKVYISESFVKKPKTNRPVKIKVRELLIKTTSPDLKSSRVKSGKLEIIPFKGLRKFKVPNFYIKGAQKMRKTSKPMSFTSLKRVAKANSFEDFNKLISFETVNLGGEKHYVLYYLGRYVNVLKGKEKKAVVKTLYNNLLK